MRRILHLRSSGGLLGAEAVILQLADALPDFGYSITVGAIYDERDGPPALLEAARARGVATIAVASRGRISRSGVRRLRREVDAGGFELIHTHGYREDIFAVLAAPQSPMVATNHLWKLTSWRLRVYAAVDALVLRRFPAIVAVSREIAQEMIRRGISSSRIEVIENGVTIAPADPARRAELRWRLRDELRVPAEAPMVLMVSSLTPEKGHELALAAFAALASEWPTTRLVIAGDGPLRTALEASARSRAITDRVVFLGRREDVSDLFAAADIFLLSSLSEGLPMALLEAMAAGLPSVATGVGEIPQVLTTHEGRVVPSRDSTALSSALRELLANPELRAKLGESSRARVASTFSARRMAQRYAHIYDRVLDGPSVR